MIFYLNLSIVIYSYISNSLAQLILLKMSLFSSFSLPLLPSTPSFFAAQQIMLSEADRPLAPLFLHVIYFEMNSSPSL